MTKKFTFPHTLGSPTSNMTLQLPSLVNFRIHEENFILFFISVQSYDIRPFLFG